MPRSNNLRTPSHPVNQHKPLTKHFLKASSTHSKEIKARDIRSLLQNKGKVTFEGRELTLNEPSYTNHILQEIIHEPTLSVHPVGASSENEECEYDLISSGRKIRVIITYRTLK